MNFIKRNFASLELASVTPLYHQSRVRVICRANTGPVGRPTPVLFEPDETSPWLNGLEVSETLLTVKKGKSSQVEIDITNNTSHEIVLRGRTLYGRLQHVQSVTSVEVKIKEPVKSASDTQPKGLQASGTTEPVQTVSQSESDFGSCLR